MGRFILMVGVLAACGDNLTVDELAIPDVEPSPKPTVDARYIPTVCGVRSWDATFAADVNASIAPGDEGASLLALSSGTLFGYVIDPRMNVTSSTKIDLGGTYSSVTASFVGGRVATTSINSSTVDLHQLDENLANPQFITSLAGTHLAQPAFYTAGSDILMPVVTDDALWLHRFYDSLEPIDSVRVMPVPKAPRSLAAAELGGRLLTAFSTDYDCYLTLTDAAGSGPTQMLTAACEHPRVAVSGAVGTMLFDSVDGVRLMSINGDQLGGDAYVIRPATHTPRIVFDGTRFWVSYIDMRGDVIIGFLDGTRYPVTMSLAGPKPGTNAYDLVMIDGAPWVITLTTDGYSAHQMCAVDENSTTNLRVHGHHNSMDKLAL